MPQIDFGKALAPQPPTVSSQRIENEKQVAPNLPKTPTADSGRRTGRMARLGSSDWTNIAFVTMALSGGLFCAFYFFNGTELVRAALAWPRELLYYRPFGPDASDRGSEIAASEQAAPDDPTASLDNRRPFGRHIGNLQLDAPLTAPPVGSSPGNLAGSPNTPGLAGTPAVPGVPGVPGIASVPGGLPVPSAPSTGSLLGQLTGPLAGGDRLAQAFNKGAADLQRATRNLNSRTIVIIQRRLIEKNARRTAGLVRAQERNGGNAVARAGNTIGSVGNTVGGVTADTLGNSSAAKLARNQANTPTRSTVSFAQSALGGIGRSSSIGGFGRGDSAGALGGAGSGFGRGGGLGGIGGGAESFRRGNGGRDGRR